MCTFCGFELLPISSQLSEEDGQSQQSRNSGHYCVSHLLSPPDTLDDSSRRKGCFGRPILGSCER